MRKLLVFSATIFFFVGFVAGVIVEDVPRLTLDTKIVLYHPLMLLLTAFIGIVIPFNIKKWIDDARFVKGELVDDIKEILAQYRVIDQMINERYQTGGYLSTDDKSKIIHIFDCADRSVLGLCDHLNSSFGKQTEKLQSEIKSESIAYWKICTGAEAMSTAFSTISGEYYNRNNEAWKKLRKALKMAILTIHKY